MKFSSGELQEMQATQDAHMMDTCLIAEPAKTTDNYNLPAKSWNWDEAEELDCGFDASPSKELLDQVPASTAVVRLPIATVVSHQARLRITHRFGVPLDTPITFDVIGTARQGPSGLMVWLSNVTDGTDGE